MPRNSGSLSAIRATLLVSAVTLGVIFFGSVQRASAGDYKNCCGDPQERCSINYGVSCTTASNCQNGEAPCCNNICPA